MCVLHNEPKLRMLFFHSTSLTEFCNQFECEDFHFSKLWEYNKPLYNFTGEFLC